MGFKLLMIYYFLFRSVTESGTEVFDILTAMSQLLLRGENIRRVALNMTENHSSEFVKQTENFVNKLPRSAAQNNSSTTSNLDAENGSQKTFVATAFPVHYCGMALPTVPYTHEDSAPLRILAKLLTSKFLLSEIREKGGAYGGGASSNPTSGTLVPTHIIFSLLFEILFLGDFFMVT